jgi:hypothetical protein
MTNSMLLASNISRGPAEYIALGRIFLGVIKKILAPSNEVFIARRLQFLDFIAPVKNSFY